MVDHATAKYLNDNVGAVLAKALAEMSISQPADGVDFLAQWLKTYADQEEAKAWREREDKLLEEERARTRKRLDEKEQAVQQKLRDKQAVGSGFQSLLDKFKNPDTMFGDEFWSELIDVTKKVMYAKSVYLGLLEEEGLDGVEGPIIRYLYDSPGSLMTEKVLPKETGVTFGALKEKPGEEEIDSLNLWKPPNLSTEPALAEGEEAPTEVGLPYYPISIPHVTDCAKIHFFDMTRLGAYLAVPLVYPSYYNQEALADAKKFETEKADEERRRAEEAAAAEAAAAEAAAAGGEAEPDPVAEKPEDAEPIPQKELSLTGTTVKMVLCMDTLGTNTTFDESKIMDLLSLCNACGECKSQTEKKQVDDQALVAINEEARQAAEEAVTNARGEAEAALQAEMEEEKAEIENAGHEPERKASLEEVLHKKYKFLQAQKVVLGLKPHIMKQIGTWVTVPPDVLGVLAALAFLIGYTREQVYPSRKSTLKWAQLATIIDDEFFYTIEKTVVSGERKGIIKEQKLSSVKSLIPADYDETKAREVAAEFEVLAIFLLAAVDYRTADLAWRKSDYEYRKKQAEESDPPEAFTEPDLIEVDDDYED